MVKKRIVFFGILFVLGILSISLSSAYTVVSPSLYRSDGSVLDTQNAINAIAEGGTVELPEGSFNWASMLTLSGKGVHLKGQGAGGFLSYSTTSNSIALGDKTFVTQAGKNYVVGETITAIYKANGQKFMVGTVKSYSGTTLVLTVNSVAGTGTYSAWTFLRHPKTTVINDYSKDWHDAIVELGGNSMSSPYSVELSGIYFKGGLAESCKNSVGDKCGGLHLKIEGAVTQKPVLIHDNRFTGKADMGRHILFTSNNGVVYRNSFDNGICASTYAGCSPHITQAIAFANEGNTYSWATPSTMGMNDIGGVNNAYIEDNYFMGFWQSALDVDSNSRTVTRYNIFDNSATGSHGADTSLMGVRHYEVYNNIVLFDNLGDDTYSLPWWFFDRGGTGVFADNIIPDIKSQAWGDKSEFVMTIMVLRRAWAQFPCWGAGTTALEYPAPRQLGFGYIDGSQSGLDTQGVYRGDSEPMYFWNNSYASIAIQDYYAQDASMCTNAILDKVSDYFVLGRDYFVETVKPGYVKYTYPHPARTDLVPQKTISDILPSDRLIDWSQAGVPGGIPSASWPICQTLSPSGGDDTAAIENALASCGITNYNSSNPQTGKVVYLNPGTYKIGRFTNSNHLIMSNVVLRGAGPDRTVLNITPQNTAYSPNIVFGNDNAWPAWPTNKIFAITSGYTKGSTAISVSSTAASAVNVGDIIMINQLNGAVGSGGSSPYYNMVITGTGIESNAANPSSDRDRDNTRNMQQVVRVTGKSANTVTFSPPLYWDYNSSLSPQMSIAPTTVHRVGLEDLKIDNSLAYAVDSNGDDRLQNYIPDETNSDYVIIQFTFADQCWVKNVETSHARNHFIVTSSVNCEIRDSYFHNPVSNWYAYGSDNGYSQVITSSALLIENNIFENSLAPTIYAGSSGTVIGYNFYNATRSPDGNQLASINTNHGAHGLYNLAEGNILNLYQADNYYGSSSHGLLYRNYILGTDYGVTYRRMAISLDAVQLYYSMIGNVLGTNRLTGWSYESSDGATVSDPVIYRLGYARMGDSGTGNHDARVKATSIRGGNYDYATNSIIWQNNAPSSSSTYLVSGTLPISAYKSSKPSWFGNVAWPPIGPDVTGGNADSAGKANKIPAQLCYQTIIAGQKFNATRCYGTGSTQTITNGVCGTTQNSCIQGTSINQGQNSTSYTWQCQGFGTGSTTASCSLFIPQVAPSITTQPSPQSAYANGQVTFSVVASGSTPLSYQWKENGVNIAGATSSTYTKTNLQLSDSGKIYSVNVSNAYGSLISSSATLTVTNAPSITPVIFINEYETAWDSSATTRTTQTFNVEAGDVLVAYSIFEGSGSTGSISGGSLTWNPVQQVLDTDYARIYVWSATVDSAKSMSVTFTSSVTQYFGGNVLVFRNSDGIGNSSKRVASVAPTLSLTTTQANSAIVVASGDWNANDGANRAWLTNAGTFNERTYAHVLGRYTVYGGYHNPVNLGTYNVGLSSPATQKSSIVGVEVKGKATTQPTFTYHPSDINSNKVIEYSEAINYINGYLSGNNDLKNTLYTITLRQSGGNYNNTASSNCNVSPWSCWTNI